VEPAFVASEVPGGYAGAFVDAKDSGTTLNRRFVRNGKQSMKSHELNELLQTLLALPHEVEWVEFKKNNYAPEDIGEYLSALSNAAALYGANSGFIVWGIEDVTHKLVGTTFQPRRAKIGNEELENWLSVHLHPRINFKIHEFDSNGVRVVLFDVPPASHTPVRFKDTEYIRVGSYKKKLKDYPEKERELWALLSRTPFEKSIAADAVTAHRLFSLIDYPAYFELSGQELPDNRVGILDRLATEKLIVREGRDRFQITNLGAILFAKDLDSFEDLTRKAVRVVVYRGVNRTATLREQVVKKGYASGFEGLVAFINSQLPENEQIGQALRTKVPMYPEIVIRELVANALIHQDFNITGTGPMIEIFADRVEITDPGIPLIDTQRFLDAPPQSRNDALAAFMRRVNICEERGSGIDKVILNVEAFQLPAPNFVVTERHTKVTLFSYKKFAEMDKDDRVRACYQHAGLRYVCNDRMTNASLRQRFRIDTKNYSMASRIIADTLEAGLIRRDDPESKSRKHAKYVPFWA
jgi:ATP-dependent DNA helicase RecG